MPSLISLMMGIKSNIFVLLFQLPMKVNIEGNDYLLNFNGLPLGTVFINYLH